MAYERNVETNERLTEAGIEVIAHRRLGTAAEAYAAGYMGLVNHMLGTTLTSSIYVPDVDAILTTNSAGTDAGSSLGTLVATCGAQWPAKPQFVLVDFWDKGDVMAVADKANGLSSGSITGRKSPSDDGDSSDGVCRSSGQRLVLGLALLAGLALAW